MNFTQAAHEVVSHPITSLAISAGAAFVARAFIKAGAEMYREHRAERAAVRAILADSSNNPVQRVQLPVDPR